jgi:RHS repeat-associated protein
VPLPERDETIETIEYSDGFGRLLQARAQAEHVIFGDPAFGGAVLPIAQKDGDGTRQDVTGTKNSDPLRPNVVVSGWQVYDNKGRVVEKYEPLFAEGWIYQWVADATRGQHATMLYDPRGQVIRTINPDGSEQRVIYGVPDDPGSPERFAPTPWEAYTYDANDNAGRTHGNEAWGYRQHWNTPSSIVIDALGRTVEAVARNRAAGDPLPPIEEHRTTSTYDIRGNLLTVTDQLGRVAFEHVYDLANRPLRIKSIDAGVRRTVLDAAGNVIEVRDKKGALVLRAYDRLNRPTYLWACNEENESLTLRERIVYGDESALALSPQQNLRGRVYQHNDEAGQLTFEAYDFKGNLLRKTRQVIDPAAVLSVFESPPPNWDIAPFRVDWNKALVLGASYTTTTSYDALNRVKAAEYPRDVELTAPEERRVLRPRYNRAGALEQVQIERVSAGQVLNTDVFVERIAYNAKGQRVLIAYGNRIMTRYAYDPDTFRLVRMRTERYAAPTGLTYQPDGKLLQDIAYTYDLAGNILGIADVTPGCGLPADPDRLARAFTYDPLYRLLSATGRETDILPPPGRDPADAWEGHPHLTDMTKARGYTQSYTYDPAGNVTQIKHIAPGNTFNRDFALQTSTGATVPDNNRLSVVTIRGDDFRYTYDDNGNLTQENSDRHFEWDHADRMRVFRTQTAGAEPSVHAHYVYDASGQRVMKLARNQAGPVEVTVYIDGNFEHHLELNQASYAVERENNTLHVMDNQSCIALLRMGAAFPGDSTPNVKYHLSDHLGSSNVVIGGATVADNDLINREEYYPYGETSFGSFARKRYRFTGKERDEESGLYYHGARYYAPWLARWASCDPAGMVDGTNLYRYTMSNPISLADSTGMAAGNEGTPLQEPLPGGTPLTPNEAGQSVLIGHEASPVGGVTDIELHSCDCAAEVPLTNGTPLFTPERIAYWSGVLYGTAQAVAFGGFLLPSPARDNKDFELGRGIGLQATGTTLMITGLIGTIGGGGVSGTGAGAIVGVPVAGVSAAYALQGAAAAEVGASVEARALAMMATTGRDSRSSEKDDDDESDRPEPQKTKKNATERPLLKPGTKEWDAAVKNLRSANDGRPRNYRVSTLDDARRLLQESRGYLPGYGKYGQSAPDLYRKGYELHLSEAYPGSRAPMNNLPHIKWKDWDNNAYGHIYYDVYRFIGY